MGCTASMAPVMASKPVANTMASSAMLRRAVWMPVAVMRSMGSWLRSTSVTWGRL